MLGVIDRIMVPQLPISLKPADMLPDKVKGQVKLQMKLRLPVSHL